MFPIQSIAPELPAATPAAPPAPPSRDPGGSSPDLREAFDKFVGNTFFSQMLSSMRKTTGKAAYFNGGRAEEIWQSQLDQVLAEKLTDASADQFSGPMFELFMLPPPK